MRIAVFLMLLGSTFFIGARAEGANCTRTWMTHTTGGTTFLIDVPDEEMRRSPTWLPSDGEPPLPPWRAARILQDWAARAHADQGGVTINRIALRRQFCRVDTNRWYYDIKYTIGAASDPCCAQKRHALVLLNGRLFPPQKQSPSDRND